MSEPNADPIDSADPPSSAELAALVRSELGLGDGVSVRVSEVLEYSNINHVFHVDVEGRSIYLKIAPSKLKRVSVSLPRARIFSEARAIQKFRELCGSAVLIPEILFVNRGDFLIGMSDVGEGRKVLMEVIDTDLSVLTEQAKALGHALGSVHSGTRDAQHMRPESERAGIMQIIYGGLFAPGANTVFPEHSERLLGEMRQSEECMIHFDLWAKNLLVRKGAPIAVVDFEGATRADPAIDLGTLFAVAWLPALEHPELRPAAATFVQDLIDSYLKSTQDAAWARRACERAFRYTSVFLAARGFGPFPYEISEEAKGRLRSLARHLASQQTMEPEGFIRLVAGQELLEIS